jgi:uncharacterized protein YgiM (DUF1202 family)
MMKWRKWSVVGVLFAMFSLFTLQPSMWVAAQSYSWTGEYYNNPYLQGSPAFTRTDGVLAFDFGNNSPGNGVGSDGFSVRWTALAAFGGGVYRFWALADDNIKITLDDGYTPILDTFGQTKIGQTVSADVPMTAGVHKVRVDYQEVSGSAYAYVTWASLASNPVGPNFPVPQVSYSNVNNGQWTAQYYNNAALSGSPVLIQSEGSPSHNWNTGSPGGSVPADNFSARWTSTQTLDAASYQLSLQADDGVRAFVDGNLVINEFHSATTNTYTANLTLGAGNHTIVIEYYEAGGNAFINYNLNRITSVVVQQPNPVNTGTVATVTAARLNVRDNPNANATILVKINRNEVYPVVGKNGDSSWFQISVNGVVGWVSGRFVVVGGNQNVAVVAGAQSFAQPVDTGFNTTALTTVNVRNSPSTRGTTILVKMHRNDVARIIGRTANNSWWMVNFNGTVGWVSSTFARIQGGAVVGQIPITG